MAKIIPTLNKQGHRLSKTEWQRQILEDLPLRSFADAVASTGLPVSQTGSQPLRADGIQVLQINVGKRCNQTCQHCHVDAGPDRKEVMTHQTAEQCIRALATTQIPTVDITGGAPELNPNFRWLVEQARALGRHVIDRCNLTVL